MSQSTKQPGLHYGPIGESAVHLAIDMQRLFAEPTPWRTPWMERVLPRVVALAETHPARLCFTRFVPLASAAEGQGTWRRYYERWHEMTLAELDTSLVDLVPALARFVPPAPVIDKRHYSPWFDTDLHSRLSAAGKDTLILSGGETEVCVFATLIGAIDLGYRVILATDALCSSADTTHDAMMTVYNDRFTLQLETATTEEILDAWR